MKSHEYPKVRMINPRKMTPEEERLLYLYLFSSPSKILLIRTSDTCELQTDNEVIQFQLKHPIAWSAEKDRYEIIKNKSISVDSPKIFSVKASLKMKSDSPSFFLKTPSPGKERLAKVESHDDDYPSKMAKREVIISKKNPKLHAKGPTIVKDSMSKTSISFYRKAKGEDLKDFMIRLRQEGKTLNFQQCLLLLKSICEAVQYQVHNVDVVHRDLKGENIIIYWPNLNGTPQNVVIDYGLAKFAHEDDSNQNIGGTRGYASPEVYRRQGTTFHSDIYALGTIFEEILLLTKELPKQEEDLNEENEVNEENIPLNFKPNEFMKKLLKQKPSNDDLFSEESEKINPEEQSGSYNEEPKEDEQTLAGLKGEWLNQYKWGKNSELSSSNSEEVESLDEEKKSENSLVENPQQEDKEETLESLKNTWLSQFNWGAQYSSSSASIESLEELSEEHPIETQEGQLNNFILRMKSDDPKMRPNIEECSAAVESLLQTKSVEEHKIPKL